jgi:hypothetical protein
MDKPYLIDQVPKTTPSCGSRTKAPPKETPTWQKELWFCMIQGVGGSKITKKRVFRSPCVIPFTVTPPKCTQIKEHKNQQKGLWKSPKRKNIGNQREHMRAQVKNYKSSIHLRKDCLQTRTSLLPSSYPLWKWRIKRGEISSFQLSKPWSTWLAYRK